ncbi:MAG: hypothetical protein AAF483_10745 [Planctomycetota bacterium]
MMHDDEDWEDSYDDEFYEEEDSSDCTVPCPECKADIYDDAERCPECGYYLVESERLGTGKPTWILLTAILLLAAYFARMIWLAAFR